MSVRLIQGDCLTEMARLEAGSVDMTVTSPPYDNLRTYNGSLNDWAPAKWQAIIRELYRLTKDGGVVIWNVADATINGSETGTSFRQALYAMERGFRLHDTMIYAKNNYMPLTHNRYEQAFEYMFAWTKGRPKTFNPIMVPTTSAGTRRNRSKSKGQENTYSARARAEITVTKDKKQHPNIFYYTVGRNDKTAHNAPFPEDMVHDHILSWSNPGDTVFDPFLGSGTTAKMALQLGRNAIGIERDPGYFRIASERVRAARGEVEPSPLERIQRWNAAVASFRRAA